MKRYIATAFTIILLLCMGVSATFAQDSATKPNATGKSIVGIASFYSDYFNGRKTASGETFKQTGMTCASNNVGLGNWIRVTNLKNNKTVVVRVWLEKDGW
jgi:rare lipoprotein A